MGCALLSRPRAGVEESCLEDSEPRRDKKTNWSELSSSSLICMNSVLSSATSVLLPFPPALPAEVLSRALGVLPPMPHGVLAPREPQSSPGWVLPTQPGLWLYWRSFILLNCSSVNWTPTFLEEPTLFTLFIFKVGFAPSVGLERTAPRARVSWQPRGRKHPGCYAALECGASVA